MGAATTRDTQTVSKKLIRRLHSKTCQWFAYFPFLASVLVLADVFEAELSEDTYLQSEMVGVCAAMLDGTSVVTTRGGFCFLYVCSRLGAVMKMSAPTNTF